MSDDFQLGIPPEYDAPCNMLPEEQAERILSQLCSGLNYMREQGTHGIVHRDLKPGNILVKSTDPLTVGITDFGYAKTISSTAGSNMTKAGTPLYVAPEMCKEGKLSHSEAGDMGHAADVYSVGIIVFNLFTGLQLVMAMAGEKLVESDVMKKIKKVYNPLLRDFILSCLQWDPEKRMKKRELLEHPYFRPSPLLPRALQLIRRGDPVMKPVVLNCSHLRINTFFLLGKLFSTSQSELNVAWRVGLSLFNAAGHIGSQFHRLPLHFPCC